eukprot:6642-Eustigmatos_ZCMA.PRE.1
MPIRRSLPKDTFSTPRLHLAASGCDHRCIRSRGCCLLDSLIRRYRASYSRVCEVNSVPYETSNT